MNKEKLYKDLVKEYDELNEKINSLDAFINSLSFEEQVPDFIERELLRGKRHCMRSYRDNLKARIKCIECQIKKKENDRKTLDEWIKMKGQVSNKPIHLVNTDEQPIEIKTQREPTFDSNPKCYCCGAVIDGLPFIKDGKPVCEACATDQHHCGLDATSQVGDGSAVVNEIPDSLKSLEGMQVIKVCGPKCKDCPCGDGLREYPSGRDASSCVKVELVGGYYICLAPLPNSIVTE